MAKANQQAIGYNRRSIEAGLRPDLRETGKNLYNVHLF